jgi:hypothetical protein
MMLGPRAVLHRMSLCTPCQTLVDADPIAVLLRRDEFGNNVLCGECRQKIYMMNTSTSMSGLLNFTYDNPSKEQETKHEGLMQGKRQLERNEQTRTEQTPLRRDFASLSTSTPKADENQWFCKRCNCKIWARPRVFDGEIEPEVWWWCRKCQKEKQEKQNEKQKDQRNTEKVAREKQRKKAKLNNDKKSRIIQENKRYPNLDKWLLR